MNDATNAADLVGDLSTPVDGVEIKFTFSADQLQPATEAFGLTMSAAKSQVVYFLDRLTDAGARRGLRLLDAGVILRLRKVIDGPDNSTLKLRPPAADPLPEAWRAGSDHQDEYRLEYDWGGRPVLTASVQAPLDRGRVKEIVEAPQEAGAALSADQRGLLAECGPELDDLFGGLVVAGPVDALRWKTVQADGLVGDEALHAERWDYEGRRFLEVSFRVTDVTQAEPRRADLLKLMTQRGLTADAGVTKTETVLRHFLER